MVKLTFGFTLSPQKRRIAKKQTNPGSSSGERGKVTLGKVCGSSSKIKFTTNGPSFFLLFGGMILIFPLLPLCGKGKDQDGPSRMKDVILFFLSLSLPPTESTLSLQDFSVPKTLMPSSARENRTRPHRTHPPHRT